MLSANSAFTANSVHDAHHVGLDLVGSKNLVIKSNVFFNNIGCDIRMKEGTESEMTILQNVLFRTRVGSAASLAADNGVGISLSRPANNVTQNYIAGHASSGIKLDTSFTPSISSVTNFCKEGELIK